ncbi:MAG: type IV toxin-antitoxin system AbiEi family antitoxin domain-containing protein [Vicinamibacterales bacterium]
MRPSPSARDLRREGIGTFFRPRDVARLGVSHYRLQQMRADGLLERVGPGLYRLTDEEATETETITMVASAVPQAIVCLLSALRVHGIGTQAPHQVWLALDRKARKPTRLPARTAIVRFSGPMLTYGVVTQQLQGVSVRITNPARTVVDCFRYRNKIGLDVAMEALRDAVRSRKASVSEIDRAAEVCRIRTVIGPYLEALAV